MTLATLFLSALVLYVDHLRKQLKRARDRADKKDRQFGVMWFRAMKAEHELTKHPHVPTDSDLERGVWP